MWVKEVKSHCTAQNLSFLENVVKEVSVPPILGGLLSSEKNKWTLNEMKIGLKNCL